MAYVDKYGRRIHNPNDDEPVYFCKHCLSLSIKQLDDRDYCDSCGHTNIGMTDIFHWDDLYVTKYGHHFLTNNK